MNNCSIVNIEVSKYGASCSVGVEAEKEALPVWPTRPIGFFGRPGLQCHKA